ncbi:MAG: hypothetical protein AAB875_07065 [Patescibacteria group bacterium]
MMTLDELAALQALVAPPRAERREPVASESNGPPIGEIIRAVLARVEEPPRFAQPRGIVTCAGGATYHVNAYVLFRLLRELGWAL